jgi:hypothetical protein
MTAFRSLSKGLQWQYRVLRALFLSGWFVRSGVGLRAHFEGSPQSIADVDLLGLHFDSSLRQRLVVGECKERKGSVKEADRVVWLLGLARILGASETLFAKPRLADGTLRFARRLPMYLWDEAAVRGVERRFELEPDTGFLGSLDIDLQARLLVPSRTERVLRGSALGVAWDYLAGPFWYSANASRIKQLAAFFTTIEDANVFGRERSAFVAEGLIALIVGACSTAGELLRGSPAQVEAAQHDLFSGGAADSRTLRDIAGRADDYYQDVLRRINADREGYVEPIHVPRLASGVAQPPSWLPAYLGLAGRFAELAAGATEILRYADLRLHALLGGAPVEPMIEMLFGAQEFELRRNVDLAALFLQRIWRVDDPLLDELLGSRPMRTYAVPRSVDQISLLGDERDDTT